MSVVHAPLRRHPCLASRLGAFWLCLLCTLPAAAQPARTDGLLTFGSFQDTSTPLVRICERVLREAYGQLGIRIQVHLSPSARSLLEAREGHIDGELCRSRQTADQTGDLAGELIRIDPPLWHADVVAFATRPLEVRDWESLAPYKVGYEHGKVGPALRLKGNPRNSASNGVENGLVKLAAGRVDVHVEEYYSAMLVLRRRDDLRNIRPVGPALERYQMHHLLNPRHADLVQPLEQVLQRMQRNGELRRIEQAVLREAGLDQLRPPPLAHEPADGLQ